MAAADPYIISGALNFGSAPGMDDYTAAYQNALSLNQQNYANILKGYQGLAQAQAAASNRIQGGYGQLNSDVLGDIANIDASQRQAIQDTYAQTAGSAAQGLVSRGLGNTTVANSVQRGLTLDRAKADIALSNQTAQLRAGYRSQLGLAGLNYANQANMQNTALGSQQLGFMNSVNAPYPNADSYMKLAMMRGAVGVGAKGGLAGRNSFVSGNSPFNLPSRGTGVGNERPGSGNLYGGVNYGTGNQIVPRENYGQTNPWARGGPQTIGEENSPSPYGDANYGLDSNSEPFVGPDAGYGGSQELNFGYGSGGTGYGIGVGGGSGIGVGAGGGNQPLSNDAWGASDMGYGAQNDQQSYPQGDDLPQDYGDYYDE